MYRQRSIGIETFLLYFMLLVIVWGYAIGWYIEEIGVMPLIESGEYYRMEHGADVRLEDRGSVKRPEGQENVTQSPKPVGDWDPLALLKAGQVFQYHISTRKVIDISYNIVRETMRFFIIESTARIKTTATAKTESSIIKFDIRDILIKEKFSVDRYTGNFNSLKYTNSFWNMETCLPTRRYFLNSVLKEGSSWEVPNTGATVQVVGVENISGFYTYKFLITEADQSHSTVWVSREVPLLIGFNKENCLGSAGASSRLVEYTSETGETFDIEPV